MSDEQVDQLRNVLYGLAGFVLDSRSAPLSEAEKTAVAERAAILEFDAGLSRCESQRTALDLHVNSTRSRARKRQRGTLQ